MTELRGLVRDRSPETSWLAAEAQTTSRMELTKVAILKILRDNPNGLCDWEIEQKYNAMRDRLKLPGITGQALRTRRALLHTEGRVRDSGRTTLSQTGRRTILWVAQ